MFDWILNSLCNKELQEHYGDKNDQGLQKRGTLDTWFLLNVRKTFRGRLLNVLLAFY